MTSNQRGGITFNILLAMLIIIIGILAYMLIKGDRTRIGRTIGTGGYTEHQTPPARPQNRAPAPSTTTFNDGLGQAESSTQYPLDEFGAGLAQADVFRRDINNDGRPDRITRRRVENGTAHFTYEYTIELNIDDEFVDITPDGFNTVEGAQCALGKLRFVFTPAFQVIKISRPWNETWTTPTPAKKDTFSIIQNQIHHIDSAAMPTVCDVAELF